jgi:hypothetical protein
MFFGGKKVVVPKKTTSTSIVDANKRAREDRDRERIRLNQIIFLQACIRQHRSLVRLASDLRAHWIIENPHFTITDAPNRAEWLLRAFREFLLIATFDASVAPKAISLLDHEYMAISINPKYEKQWLIQAIEALKLGIKNFSKRPEIWSVFLDSFAHQSTLTKLIGSDTPASKVLDIVSTIAHRLMPQIEDALKFLLNCNLLSSKEIPLIQFVMDVLEHNELTLSSALAIVKIASRTLPDDLFQNGPLCEQTLSIVMKSLKYLDTQKMNPMTPINKINYLEVTRFIVNRMNLYSSMTGASSIEVFAAEIALQLEKINQFEKEYRKELEDEEDFLDANDVPEIEKRYQQTRDAKDALSKAMEEVTSSATSIFSEERLFGLISKLSEISSKSMQLDSFESVAVLMSRLKNTIGISTEAFLALSSPLIPLWSTIHERYSDGMTVEQIDSSAPLLSLYCQSYSFYLSTKITDMDFFSKQRYLTMSENLQMVVFFKTLVQDRCDIRFLYPIGDDFIGLMKSFNNLLLQLQARNYIRTWAKTDDLLLPKLKAKYLANPSHTSHLIALHCPMLIPMMEKVRLFTHWVTIDREEHQEDDMQQNFQNWAFPGNFAAPGGRNNLTVNIRRGPMLLSDAFQKLMPLHLRLKEKLKVQFLSEDGTPEPGIDGGGLFRELFTEVVKLAFSPDFGLFSTTEEHALYPNPHALNLVEDALRKIQFLGQLLGKCIYESLLVDLPFAHFFLNILQGHSNSVRDLASYDPVLAQSLQQLLDMPNPEELALTFEFGEKQVDGTNQVVELIPGGRQVAVTAKNAVSYVQLIADRRLNQSIHAQSKAFMRGIADVIDLKWLQLFSPPELSLAICGGGRLDIEDLRQNIEFAGGFHDGHPTVLLLWEVLEELSSEEQQAFLKFVTSVSRPPILGFGALQPRLCIRLNKTDASYLPTANTCLNLLKIPAYPTKAALKEKLLYAINSGARFELS